MSRDAISCDVQILGGLVFGLDVEWPKTMMALILWVDSVVNVDLGSLLLFDCLGGFQLGLLNVELKGEDVSGEHWCLGWLVGHGGG